MRIVVATDPAELERIGADLVAGWLAGCPAPVVVPAVGRSALGVYAELGRRRDRGRIDTSAMTLVQLDEYLDIGPDDPRSLHAWLLRDAAGPLGVPAGRVVRLPGDAIDPAAAAVRHAQTIAMLGGIDVAILGLGPNGHLGFNEPPSPADAPTRVVELTAESRRSSAGYWDGALPVPRRALTIGMVELLRARHILLVVQGTGKRDILRRLLLDPPSPDVPGSLLWGTIPAVLLADRAAWPTSLPESHPWPDADRWAVTDAAG